jgi:hypothetical protein
MLCCGVRVGAAQGCGDRRWHKDLLGNLQQITEEREAEQRGFEPSR